MNKVLHAIRTMAQLIDWLAEGRELMETEFSNRGKGYFFSIRVSSKPTDNPLFYRTEKMDDLEEFERFFDNERFGNVLPKTPTIKSACMIAYMQGRRHEWESQHQRGK